MAISLRGRHCITFGLWVLALYGVIFAHTLRNDINKEHGNLRGSTRKTAKLEKASSDDSTIVNMGRYLSSGFIDRDTKIANKIADNMLAQYLNEEVIQSLEADAQQAGSWILRRRTLIDDMLTALQNVNSKTWTVEKPYLEKEIAFFTNLKKQDKEDESDTRTAILQVDLLKEWKKACWADRTDRPHFSNGEPKEGDWEPKEGFDGFAVRLNKLQETAKLA